MVEDARGWGAPGWGEGDGGAGRGERARGYGLGCADAGVYVCGAGAGGDAGARRAARKGTPAARREEAGRSVYIAWMEWMWGGRTGACVDSMAITGWV